MPTSNFKALPVVSSAGHQRSSAAGPRGELLARVHGGRAAAGRPEVGARRCRDRGGRVEADASPTRPYPCDGAARYWRLAGGSGRDAADAMSSHPYLGQHEVRHVM